MQEFLGWMLALGATVIWAFTPVLYRRSGEHFSVWGINAVRCIGYLATAGLYLAMTEGARALLSPPSGEQLFAIIAGGVVWLVVGDAFFFAALNRLGVAVTSAVTSAYPLLAVPVSCLFLGESFHLSLLFAAALIGGGLYLVAPREDGTEALRNRTGMFFAFAAMVCWLAGLVSCKVSANVLPVAEIEWWRALGVTGVSWLVFLLREGRFGAGSAVPSGLRGAPASAVLWTVAAGALSLTVGNLLFTGSLTAISAVVATNIVSIRPFLSALFGALLLRERLTPRLLGGIGLVVSGVAAMSF